MGNPWPTTPNSVAGSSSCSATLRRCASAARTSSSPPNGRHRRDAIPGRDIPMSATERLDEEIAFHDRQARQRAADLRRDDDLLFRDEEYLGHETWIRPAMDRLGPLAGLRVLDFGC